MYLKRIEAQGFKSFANKTILEFNPGIMGIVGPNGSGKSNVVDAVRWVLGEQSAKQLRGSNMQDVIFAGTASRKPQGYAYVTLTIDNADHALPMDFDDIIITRRVYRSGESEYMINGNACRLRDINELFYDTGVGKEGYSIIGQGQIDKILSTKPEDRRELFDEAAGIVKFKKRKDISLKKLAEEQNNLLRVSDILGELEKQVGPIREQAETARVYLKLRDELKTLEVGAFHRESEELRKKLTNVNEKLDLTKSDFEEANATAEKMKADYEEVSGKRDELDKQIEEDRLALSAINVEKENLDGRVKVLDEQISSMKSTEDELKVRLSALDQKQNTINKDKEKYTVEKGEINDKIDEMDDALVKAQDAIEDQEDLIRQKEQQLEMKQSGLLDEVKNQAGLDADSQSIVVKFEQATSRKAEISNELKVLDESIIANKANETQANDELASIKSQISSKEKESNEKNISLEKLERDLTKTESTLAEKLSSFKVAESRLESLKNMAERYDGYGESIKHVMNAKKSNKAIKGVIADIITVDKMYEVAVETALGGHIQNVVTTDEKTAKEMVEFLKKGRLGRVTFLPMDAVKGGELIDKSALDEEGIIDTANHLVSFDAEYEGVINRLLGRTLVADSIVHALAVAKKYKYKLHIVTLEGEYLAPGGSITGGAFKNTSNLLSRKREIEVLEKDIEKIGQEGQELSTKQQELTKQIGEIRERISVLADELGELKVNEASISANLESLTADRERLEAEQAQKFSDRDTLTVLIEDLNAQIQNSKDAKKEAEEAENRRREETEKLIAEIESERVKLRELNETLTAMKLEFSKLQERDSFLIENIDRINVELDGIDDEKRELLIKSDPEGLKTLIKEKEKSKLLKNIESLQASADELDAKLTEATKARDSFAENQKKLLADRDESVDRAAKLDKDMLRLTNQQERITEQIEAQAKYLWDEYEMTPMEAEAHKYEGEESLSQMRHKISDIKTEIRDLGPVNVNAIEEEKEVGERYEFLSTQHEDLVKARDSILEVIKELEKGMRAQFEEKFAAIKAEFDIVFKELFGGGKGTIELIPEPDGDILKAGVAIIAQPPGKKLQNMMQLSGGEKALTAIALIFAIQNLKPSPFCLLDEIEAALDETNVARFADYLGKLKTTTQLITITHRRGTMEAADKLYGITMQEKGISTLVSVNLSNAEEFSEV